MKVKVVLHIDIDEKPRMAMAIGNLKNLLNEVDHESSFISLLANGSGAKLFIKENSKEFAADIKDLADKGVKFFVCNNSINKFEIDRDRLFKESEIVKAGVLKLIQLQSDEGCSYIKP